MLLSIAAGIATGNLEKVTNALLGGGEEAVRLSIALCGAICFWSGIMRVAEKGGLTRLLARVMSPLMRILFPGLELSGTACRAILMNIAANFLGLGNAATPLGIRAMGELSKINRDEGTASNHMITFVALNTASIQLLPTTVAALRLKHGSASPLDILPAVWVASLLSAAVAVTLSRLLAVKEPQKAQKRAALRASVRA
jgi:spore maturation protein A